VNQRQRWLHKPFACRRDHAWLINHDSLTARLQQRYVQFSVQTQSMRLARAMQDEIQLLGLKPHQLATVREVRLIGNQQAVVFAHSVIPRNALRGQWHRLARLGNQPLGALLFANPQVKRTPLRYKKLTQQHQLYQKAVAHLNHAPTYLWARRSVFYLNCASIHRASILVTEVFLPQLYE
jgi:chorismate--pyruvate lyase